ncbi:3-deoxy-D-manno-octulosonic acid transferase [Magnetococcales bacterium HHB-1]
MFFLWLYHALFLLLLLLTLPFWLWRFFTQEKYQGTLKSRLGIHPDTFWSATKNRPCLWLHAVSVGETLAAISLVKKLRQHYPEHLLIVSTVTKTGQKVAKENLDADFYIYLPIDLYWIVWRVIKRIDLQTLIVMETELWPALFSAAHRKKAPIILVNGRLSERSSKGYHRLRYPMRTFLKPITLAAMQSNADAKRLRPLLSNPQCCQVMGNIKYDQAAKKPSPQAMAALHQHITPDPRTVWLAASTHPGEEEQLIPLFKALKKKFPTLKWILVPRHPERAPALLSLLQNENLSTDLFSHITAKKSTWSQDVLLIDEVGWLKQLYSLATVVTIGGSLIPHGGQNLLEPASWSIAPIFGPHMFNFTDAVQQILNAQGGIQVASAQEMKEALQKLLLDQDLRTTMGEKAHQALLNNQGALDRTINAICHHYKKSD